MGKAAQCRISETLFQTVSWRRPGEGEVGSLSGRQKAASLHLAHDGSYKLEAEKRQQKLVLQRSQVLFHKYITGSKIHELSRN